MAHLISTQNLSKSFGIRPLFEQINFSVEDGERLGLIGPNGSGKSTMMQILADCETPDSGEVSRRRGIVTGYVPQRDDFPARATVRSALNAALAKQALEDVERDARVAAAIGRIGFADPDQAADTLSGGWRKRLSIAAQLIVEPDLLLLDEPTNHLDVEGILWLEDALKASSAACIVVSHDRYFLEHVCTRTLELSASYPQGYFEASGPYSAFLDAREEFLAAQGRQEAALASRVRREIEWLRRGPPARSTKAKYRIDAAGRMMQDLSDLRERNAEDRGAKIDFTASGRKTRDLLVARGISKSLGGRLLFGDLDLVLSPGMRLGLLGPNGAGKSTLLRVLAGELAPDAGQIKMAERLNVVWFEQDRTLLEPGQSLRQALSGNTDTVSFRGATMHVSAWARRFLFRPEQLDVPIRTLSGGEQARVLIAGLMLRPADLLILDEPTNDLDIPTLELLEESLVDFPGALALVTHDRFMLDRVSTEILALDGAGSASFFADYSQWLSRSRQSDAPQPAQRPAARPPAGSPRTFRGLTRPEQRELDRMEDAISEAEAKLAALQQEMSLPDVVTDYVKLQDCMARVEQQEKRITGLYDRWQELEAKRQ